MVIKMKLLIASDLHGDAEATARLLEIFRREGAARLVLLGDILYHGPRNPLPAGYDPQGVIALLDAVKGHDIAEAENTEMNHSMPINDERYARWMAELQADLTALEG